MDIFQELEETADEKLPEIGANETFTFACGPEMPCYNRCCAELTLPLTPYDILRLRWQGDNCVPSQEFLSTFTEMNTMPDTGLPLPMLRMIDSPDAPCPFVTPAGCSVYENRPSACRAYPLGRGSKISASGIDERFFIVREPHCQGFGCGESRTPAQWFGNQELEPYTRFNDRYMRLMSMIRASGKPLDKRMGSMCFLCLYQLDLFRGLIEKMRIFSRVVLDRSQQEKIMKTNSQASDEACLDFALEWLELAIFGKAKNLEKSR